MNRTSKHKPTRVGRIVNGAFIVHEDGREECLQDAAGRREYSLRREAMVERQGCRCAICGFAFDGYLGAATTDHQRPRGMGGAFTDDRLEIDGVWVNAAVHQVCNTIKGSKHYEWRNNNQEYVACV